MLEPISKEHIEAFKKMLEDAESITIQQTIQVIEEFPKTISDPNSKLRKQSGSIDIDNDSLTSLFYTILRDGHIAPGDLESIVRDVEKEESEVKYCNGWLALYAQNLANRIRGANEQ